MATLKESRYLNRTVETSIHEKRLLTVTVQPELARRGSFEIPSFIIKCHHSDVKQKVSEKSKYTTVTKQNKNAVVKHNTFLFDRQQFGKLHTNKKDGLRETSSPYYDDVKCTKCKERLRKVDEFYEKSQQPKEQKYDKSCGPISLRRLIEYQAESVKSAYQSCVSVPTKTRESIDKVLERNYKKEKVKLELERMDRKMERRIKEMSSAYHIQAPITERKYKFSDWNRLVRKDGSDHMHCVEVTSGNLQLTNKHSLYKSGSKQLCQLFRSTRLAAWREVRFRQENILLKFSDKSYLEFITRLSYILSSGRRKHLLYLNLDNFEKRMKFLGKIQLLSKIRRTETEKRMAISKRTFPKYKVSRKRLTIRGSFVIFAPREIQRKSCTTSRSTSESSLGKGGADRSRTPSRRGSSSEGIVVEETPDIETSESKEEQNEVESELDAKNEEEQALNGEEILDSIEETVELKLDEEELDGFDEDASSLASRVKDSIRDVLSPHRRTPRSPRSPREKKKSASCCSVL